MNNPEKIIFKRVGDKLLNSLFYRPKKCFEKSPVCFWFHGGGWIAGEEREPELFPILLESMLSAGIAVVSCGYRLSDGETCLWPELIGDCSDFVRFYAANADEFSLDTERALTAGISAGGHLSLLEAFDGERFGTDDGTPFPRFRCVLDMCGPVSLAHGLMAKEKAMIKIYFRRFLSMDESRWPEIYPKVDPLAAAKMADVSRLVPVIAVHGTEDELVHPSQPLMLKDVYDGIGAEFSLVTVKNGTHSFGNVPGFPLASPNIEEIQCLLFGFAEKHVL